MLLCRQTQRCHSHSDIINTSNIRHNVAMIFVVTILCCYDTLSQETTKKSEDYCECFKFVNFNKILASNWNLLSV